MRARNEKCLAGGSGTRKSRERDRGSPALPFASKWRRIERRRVAGESEISRGTRVGRRSSPGAFRRCFARTLAHAARAAWKGYFRSNGVESQALLSHFALQCFNISLCLCRPRPAGRGRGARPGARITLNGGEDERVSSARCAQRGAAAIFRAVRVQ